MGVYFDNKCTQLSVNFTITSGDMIWYTTDDGETHYNGLYTVSGLNYKALLLTDVPKGCKGAKQPITTVTVAVTNTYKTVEFFDGDYTACPLDIVTTFEPNVCGVPSGGSSYIFICPGQPSCASSISPPAATTAPQVSTTSKQTAKISPTSTTRSAAATSTSVAPPISSNTSTSRASTSTSSVIPSPTSTAPPSTYDESDKIALGVGIGFGIPMFLLACFGTYLMMKY